MDAALFNKPQGSGARGHRNSPNGGGSRSPASTASVSPNSRVPRGSSNEPSLEIAHSRDRVRVSRAEAYSEDGGTQPPMVPRKQLEATVSTLN